MPPPSFLMWLRVGLILLLCANVTFSSGQSVQSFNFHNSQVLSGDIHPITPTSGSLVKIHHTPEFFIKTREFFSKDTLRPFKRFLYSNYVMVTSSVAGHLYVYLGDKDFQFNKTFKSRNIENTFTLPPVWDTDHWTYNYLVHSGMGALTYLAYRNRGGKWWDSFIVSNLNSILYEYVLASSTQRPSKNDLIITPVGGLITGEAIYQLKKWMKKDGYLTVYEKVSITLLDPYEVFRHWFDYSKLCQKPGIR